MVIQYLDKLTWVSKQEQIGVDEWGQPIYDDEDGGSVIGRYENFKGSKKEFLDVDGITVVQNDGVFYCKPRVKVPNRFDLVEVRDTKFQVLNIYKGQLNTTIHLKEVK